VSFTAGLRAVPASHRANLPLWLDHFDSLCLGGFNSEAHHCPG
jgi:hypothetical protein